MNAPLPNRCGTCAHWQDSEGEGKYPHTVPRAVLTERDDAFSFFDFSAEDRAAMQARVKLCVSPKLQFFVAPAEGEAAVVDGSEYWAGLCTTASFGCTNWEGVSP